MMMNETQRTVTRGISAPKSPAKPPAVDKVEVTNKAVLELSRQHRKLTWQRIGIVSGLCAVAIAA